jgi:hypothetical protein
MMTAVGQSHRQINHRKAKRALPQKVFDPLLRRWNVIPWHRAAGYCAHKLKPGTAWLRVNGHHHITKLAMPTGLFFMPCML